jgi:hypothetical protein
MYMINANIHSFAMRKYKDIYIYMYIYVYLYVHKYTYITIK